MQEFLDTTTDEIIDTPNGPLDLSVLGTSGLRHSGGYIDEEFHLKLKGSQGAKVYREMSDNSSTIGAIQFIVDTLIRQVEWRAEASEQTPEAQEWSLFLEQCMTDMDQTFDDFVSEVVSFLIYGWCYFEKVYKIRRGDTEDKSTKSKYEDGRIGWRKLALRAQDTLQRWEFDTDTGDLLGMHQQDIYAGRSAYLPIEKCVLFTTRKYKDNPEGRSLYRNAVIDYFYLKRISQIEAMGVERDLSGIPVMEVPISLLHPDSSASDKLLRRDLEKMLAEIKNDERAYALVPSEQNPKDGLPTGYKFKLLSSGGSRAFDTTGIKNYYKVNILQTVFAQFIQLGMAGVGSFALASSQTNMFSVALGSILDIITSTFNRSCVWPLMKLNGCPAELCPELVHGDIETPPLDEIGAYVTALASAGQLPEDDAIKRKLLEFGGLPIPKIEEGLQMQMAQNMPAPPMRGVPAMRSVTINNAPTGG